MDCILLLLQKPQQNERNIRKFSEAHSHIIPVLIAYMYVCWLCIYILDGLLDCLLMRFDGGAMAINAFLFYNKFVDFSESFWCDIIISDGGNAYIVFPHTLSGHET